MSYYLARFNDFQGIKSKKKLETYSYVNHNLHLVMRTVQTVRFRNQISDSVKPLTMEIHYPLHACNQTFADASHANHIHVVETTAEHASINIKQREAKRNRSRQTDQP